MLRRLRARFRCWLHGHDWFTIIRSVETAAANVYEHQRCHRCGMYREVKISDQQRVREMT